MSTKLMPVVSAVRPISVKECPLALSASTRGSSAQDLHEDDAVGAAGREQAHDVFGLCRRGAEQKGVVARARRLRRPGDECLLDRDEVPVRGGQEQRNRVGGAACERSRRAVRAVVELGDGFEHLRARLVGDGALAAQGIGDRAQRDAGAFCDLGHGCGFFGLHRNSILLLTKDALARPHLDSVCPACYRRSASRSASTDESTGEDSSCRSIPLVGGWQ